MKRPSSPDPSKKDRSPGRPRKQDALLDATSYCLEQAFQAASLEDAFPVILARLGEAFRASHVFLYEDRPGGLELRSEWADPAAASQPARLASLSYKNGFQRWQEAFRRGELIHGTVSALAASEQQFFPAGGVSSFAIAPVGCGSQSCGIVGLDDCRRTRRWTAAELEALRTAAQILGEARHARAAVEAERRERILAEALRDTAAALNGSLVLEDVLDQILAHTERVVPYDGMDVRLVDGGMAHSVRMRGYFGDETAKKVLSQGFPVTEVANLRRMSETRQPLIIADTWSEPGWLKFPETHWIRSYLGAPVLRNGEVIGFLNLASATPGFFSKEAAERLQAFADQAAVAIENARLFKETQRNVAIERERTDQLTRANSLIAALGHVSARVSSAPDPAGVMETLGTELKRLGVNCFVALRDPDHPSLISIRYLSVSSELQPYLERWTESGLNSFPLTPERFRLFEQIVVHRQPAYISGPERLVHAILSDIHARHVLQIIKAAGASSKTKGICAPLVVEDKVLGLLTVWGEDLSESDTPAIAIFASQVAIALDNARLRAETQRLAVTDELTGLLNRRGLFEAGQKEIERASRFNRPLSAIMFDVDHFKEVNDLYGHIAGDEVLQAIAAVCREAIREVDILGRYGGEEYVVLLLETDPTSARLVAERLREKVRGMPFRHGEAGFQLTISLGVAGMDETVSTMAAFIERADRALYLAKQNGRDQVATYPE